MNIIEKIWRAHAVHEQAGFPAILSIDLHLIHEVTSAQAFQMLRAKKLKVAHPERCLATMDHSIPTRQNRQEIFDLAAKKQVNTLRKNTKEFGIPLFDMDSGSQGIVHVIGPELGLTQPGLTIVCGDSHTSTHGAFGALAFGIGTTEVGHVLATGCLLQSKPKTMRVNFTGHFKPGVYAKDAILKLIADIGIGGANGHIIEYTGEAIRKMTMEERMTICNMSIECGARAGLVGPDETTYNYILGRDTPWRVSTKARPFAPKSKDQNRAIQYWNSFQSDPDATYDKNITVDLSNLDPMITWGINPEQAIQITEKIPLLKNLPPSHHANTLKALEYTKLKAGQAIAGVPIQWAFMGSCTNSRIEDLRIVAKILKNKKIHPSVTMYIVPGSEKVKAQAEKEGLDKIFIKAGANWRLPGCSMCLGMNDDKVPAGQRCISTSNRNFIGRQGPGSITHLASPATVAASAIAGYITAWNPSPCTQGEVRPVLRSCTQRRGEGV